MTRDGVEWLLYLTTPIVLPGALAAVVPVFGGSEAKADAAQTVSMLAGSFIMALMEWASRPPKGGR